MEILDELEPQSYSQKSKYDYLADIFIVIGLALVYLVVFTFVCVFVFKIKMNTDLSFSSLDLPKLKLLNVIISIGAFLLAPLTLFFLRKYNPIEFIKLKLPKSFDTFFGVIFVLFPLLIVAGVLNQFFQNIKIPKFLEFLNSEQNQILMKKMLEMNSTNDLFVNILVIGLAPAILEEIFFRGTLQNLFSKFLSNKHLAILFTSILFTLIHFNIKQFIPMLFLALFLGYLYHITKSLWLPILVHFCNNSLAVVAYYKSNSNPLANRFIQDEVPFAHILVLPAALSIGLLFYWLIKIKKYSFNE